MACHCFRSDGDLIECGECASRRRHVNDGVDIGRRQERADVVAWLKQLELENPRGEAADAFSNDVYDLRHRIHNGEHVGAAQKARK